MILRRVIEHVKAQNWFAVAIDFVIVVVGVFVGLQVNNWNEGRAAHGRETEFLRELRDEIVVNNSMLDARIAYTKLVIAAGERTSDFLVASEPCSDNCERVIIDAFHASQRWGSDPVDVVASEMFRQGLPRSTDLKKKMRSFYQADDGAERDFSDAGQYRQRVRRIMPIARQKALWRECFTFTTSTEALVSDCSTGAAPEEARRESEALRAAAGLRDDLNYWTGQNTLWLSVFENQAREGQSLLAAIDEELGRRK